MNRRSTAELKEHFTAVHVRPRGKLSKYLSKKMLIPEHFFRTSKWTLSKRHVFWLLHFLPYIANFLNSVSNFSGVQTKTGITILCAAHTLSENVFGLKIRGIQQKW